MSVDSTGPSTSASKEETYLSSPEDIRSLPKRRPRKSQNANKKKRRTAILTDTPIKNSLKKTTVHDLEQMRKLDPRKEEKEACVTFLVRAPQKEHQKSSRNQRMHETQKKKAPRIVYACTVWTHILEVRPEKCGFIA